MPTVFSRVPLLLVLPLLGLLAACEPTGNPRCDRAVWDIQARIEYTYGWRLNCDPPASDPRYEDFGQVGQAGPDNTVWIWPDRISVVSGERLLRKVAWHELGHVVHLTRGLPLTGQEREKWADGFAWCIDPIQGVGYRIMPRDCTPYR